MSVEASIQNQDKKLVVKFYTYVRSRPHYVNGKEYKRFFALIPSRSDASKLLNAIFSNLENRELKDIRLVDDYRVFFIPSASVYTERTRASGKTLRFTIPTLIGEHLVNKEVFVYGYVSKGDSSVKRIDSKTYHVIAIFDAKIVKSSKASIPVRFSSVIPIGKYVEVDIIADDTIKSVEAITYKNGSYRGQQLVSLLFDRDEVSEFASKRVTLVVKVA